MFQADTEHRFKQFEEAHLKTVLHYSLFILNSSGTMDPNEQTRRWETAQEHYKAAELLSNQALYKASVSRCYYACFQAMWVAVGDPPLGHWKHAGLMQNFCHGKWTAVPVLPTSFASIYKKLLALYDLRLDADYRALVVDQSKAQEALQTTKQVLDLVTLHKTP